MNCILQRTVDVVKYRLLRKKSKKKRPRRYIHPDLGITGFFEVLQHAEVQYCILRWFEQLPDLDEGEDIDMLVADEHLDIIEPLLNGTKSHGIPCDIYTVNGLPGTAYNNIAYFPGYLAQEVLDSAIWFKDLFRVPNARCHLLTMAYHVVYHKGYRAGTPSTSAPPDDRVDREHDYAAVLTECAKKANMPVPVISLEQLDKYLSEYGWRPPMDSLQKLALKNQWVYDHFFSKKPVAESHWDGFTLFIVREKGVDNIDVIRRFLECDGFTILREYVIADDKQQDAAVCLRGGNWSKGPWPVSGGLPAYVFVVYDCYPIAPDQDLLSKHPGLANARILISKTNIRDKINKQRMKTEMCNVIHSADNPEQAIEYYRLTYPENPDMAMFEREIKEISDRFQTPFPVISQLSRHSRRAKVELVEYKGKQAVCKTFRPTYERFLKREIQARQLGKDLPEVSPILEYGDNYIVLPYYRDCLEKQSRLRPLCQKNKLFPIWVIQRIKKIIAHFRSMGYELVDFQPHNVIIDKCDGLKIIDFEFVQSGHTTDSDLRGNYAWYRIPDDFQGDIPAGSKYKRFLYYRYWYEFTGIPLSVCVRPLPNKLLLIVQCAGWFHLSILGVAKYIQLKTRKIRKP